MTFYFLDDALCKRGVLVGSETCWPLADALAVIDAAASADLIVLGVEVWELSESSDTPRVLGWSTYKVKLDRPDWSTTVREAQQFARHAVENAGDLNGSFVNFTFADQEGKDPEDPSKDE